MKQCSVCGYMAEDRSAFCPACGNRFPEMVKKESEDVASPEKNDGEPVLKPIRRSSTPLPAPIRSSVGSAAGRSGAEQMSAAVRGGEESASAAGSGAEPAAAGSGAETVSAAAGSGTEPARATATVRRSTETAPAAAKGSAARRPRRVKSGPQIYGQLDQDGDTVYSQQGAIRRDISGKSSDMTAGMQRETVNGAGKMTPSAASGSQKAARQDQPADKGAGASAGNMQGAHRPESARRPQRAGRPVTAGAGQPMAGGAPQPAAGGGQLRTGRSMAGAPQGAGQPMTARGPQGQPGVRRMPQSAGQPVNRPMGQMQAGAPRQPQGFASGRIMEAARAAMRSPLFLLIVLFHTVFLAGSVAAVFMGQLNYSQVARLLAGLQLPAQLSTYMNAIQSLLSRLDSGALVVNLVLCVPALLFCIGLWLVFISSRSEDEMSGAGFTFMKAVVIINMIKACVLMLVALVVGVVLVISAWVSGTGAIRIMSVVLMVLVIVVTMAMIMYYFCYLATIRCCRVNALSGDQYGRASAYVAVIHITGALTGIVGILSGIVNMEIAGIVKSAGSLGWMLLFGIWLLSYRSRLSEFED